MHQRYRRPILTRGLAKAQPAADTEDLRMVCGAAHERDARDGGAGYASCSGGYLWGTYGDCAAGYEEFDGILRAATETALRGRLPNGNFLCLRLIGFCSAALTTSLLMTSSDLPTIGSLRSSLTSSTSSVSENRRPQLSTSTLTKLNEPNHALRCSTWRIKTWNRG